jgi:hypothetical protein
VDCQAKLNSYIQFTLNPGWQEHKIFQLSAASVREPGISRQTLLPRGLVVLENEADGAIK